MGHIGPSTLFKGMFDKLIIDQKLFNFWLTNEVPLIRTFHETKLYTLGDYSLLDMEHLNPAGLCVRSNVISDQKDRLLLVGLQHHQCRFISRPPAAMALKLVRAVDRHTAYITRGAKGDIRLLAEQAVPHCCWLGRFVGLFFLLQPRNILWVHGISLTHAAAPRQLSLRISGSFALFLSLSGLRLLTTPGAVCRTSLLHFFSVYLNPI